MTCRLQRQRRPIRRPLVAKPFAQEGSTFYPPKVNRKGTTRVIALVILLSGPERNCLTSAMFLPITCSRLPALGSCKDPTSVFRRGLIARLSRCAHRNCATNHGGGPAPQHPDTSHSSLPKTRDLSFPGVTLPSGLDCTAGAFGPEGARAGL